MGPFPSPPPAVRWITAAWLALLVSFLLLTPLFQGPDEPLHVDRVLDNAAFAGFEEPTEGAIRADLNRLLGQWHAESVPPKFSADSAPPHPRSGFADMGPDRPEVGRNQQNQHPPAYYALMATARTAVTALTPADLWTADREMLLLRVFNVLLMTGVPYLCWATTRQLRWPPSVGVLAALVPLAIPQLAFIGSTVNNDNLVIPAAALVFLAGARVLNGPLDRTTAALLGGSTALALLTKGTAVVLIPFVVVVCIVAWRRGGIERRAAVGTLCAGALGGIFYLRNLVLHGQPFASMEMLTARRSGPIQIGAFIESIAERTAESFWGKFGWLTVPMPVMWTYLLSLLLVVVLVVAAVRSAAPRLRVMLMTVPIALGLYAINAFSAYNRTGLFPGQQGRYMFICIVPLSLGVAAFCWDRTQGARRVMLALVVVNHLVAVVTMIDFYRPGGLPGALRSISAWNPLGVLGAVALLIAWAGVLVSLAGMERSELEGARPAE